MSNRSRLLSAAVCACVSLPAVLLSGCSDDGTITQGTTKAQMAQGNWQIAAAAGSAPALSSLSGSLTSSADKISVTMHSQAASACTSPKTSFVLSGAANSDGVVTLTGPAAGGTMSLTGTLADDGKSLTSATYSVVGGSCALPAKVQATVEAFQPITGSYGGTFSDVDGQVASISASLTQSPSSDANGNFTLSGTATLPNNPCFPAAVPISATSVTGGNFTFTYATSDNSVTASGIFSQDASTLTVTSWSSTGTCGADHGTGAMTRQSGS